MAGKFMRDAKKKAPPQAPAGDFGNIEHEEIPPSTLSPDEGQFADGKPPDQTLPDIKIKEPDARKTVSDIARQNTKYRVPAQGGEPINALRTRSLPVVRAAMQELAHDPSKYIPITMQPEAVALVDAWIDAGMPDDYSVNPEVMKQGVAGDVQRLYPVREAPGWRKEPVKLDGSPLPPPPGILLLSHGTMDAEKKAGKHQDAVAQLAKHVKSGDFGRARAFANLASTEMGLSDEDINAVIDSSLPSAKEAADLPHDKLLAIASAAYGSPKFAEYADLLKERFGNLEGLPPAAQQQLKAHLGVMGL